MKRTVAALRLVATVVVAVLGQLDRRDITMLIGLALVGHGLSQVAGLSWLGEAVPGGILVLAALGLSLTRKVAS